MLPFLKKSKDAGSSGIVIKTRTPDEAPESTEENDSDAAINACAQALISAVHSRDAQGVAQALKDAMDILQSMPSEESPEPHSYDASKED